FGDAKDSDYLWFYNLNGVHYTSDKDLASTSGYEEWRAVTGPRTNVPDGGTTATLLGLGLLGLAASRRKS
ncbi:MAG: VPDSG-CTERM sorting domain-containing protein, partial [Limisphaerales bacterium]